VSWESPDGRRGDDHPNDEEGFAGPSGPWRFDWSGVSAMPLATATVAAYAPIGEDWTFFRPQG
jgi:hypothetical protein